jgi:hypothetical protein
MNDADYMIDSLLGEIDGLRDELLFAKAAIRNKERDIDRLRMTHAGDLAARNEEREQREMAMLRENELLRTLNFRMRAVESGLVKP